MNSNVLVPNIWDAPVKSKVIMHFVIGAYLFLFVVPLANDISFIETGEQMGWFGYLFVAIIYGFVLCVAWHKEIKTIINERKGLK